MLSRRTFLSAGGAAAAGLFALDRFAAADSSEVSIAMTGTPKGDDAWFDPVGLWVPPGTVIRWFVPADHTQAHTTAAYHPANKTHPLRIPKQAKPWNSGYITPGNDYRFQMLAEGVYDYYCQPHEDFGMVGRIVVGTLTGRELADFDDDAARHPEWAAIPRSALEAFPSVDDIVRQKKIPHRLAHT